MNILRKRAQEQFPTVLLTLLSIVQALALELLWEHVQETSYLAELNWYSFLSWIQIFATLLGIVLIWVAYASNAMRFRWTPSTSDSIYPFIIGLLEFYQIELLGPEHIGHWTIIMAVIFGVMVLVSHFIMRRARHNGDNGNFFQNSNPATIKDFYPHIAVISLLILGGGYAWVNAESGGLALTLILLILALLSWQYWSAAKFWESSIAADD